MPPFDALYATADPASALLQWALEPCRVPACCDCRTPLPPRKRNGLCDHCAKARSNRRYQAARRARPPIPPLVPLAHPRPAGRPALRLVGAPLPIVESDGVHCGICGAAAPPLTASCCTSCFAALSSGASPTDIRQGQHAAVSA